MARGDVGKNPLDAACKQHDIAYANSSDSNTRYIADGILAKEAMGRVFAKDASLGERATALAVSAAMKAKRSLTKFGQGLKRRACKRKTKNKLKNKKKNRTAQTCSLNKIIKRAHLAVKTAKPDTVKAAIKVALVSIKKTKKGTKVKPQERLIKMPPISGGVLPLIPIFAGLSALGSIVGSTTSILKAINEYKNAHSQLDESKRHNRTLESIAIGKGFYLQPFKKGRGFYLKPQSKNH